MNALISASFLSGNLPSKGPVLMSRSALYTSSLFIKSLFSSWTSSSSTLLKLNSNKEVISNVRQYTSAIHGKSWYNPKRKAIVLLSGGLDSATVLALASKKFGYDCHTLAFDYGQRHRYELQAAQKVATSLGVKDHRVVTIDLRMFGGSALTSDTLDVPKNRDEATISSEIPRTYVPARNTIFLSFALAFAETIGSHDIFIGANQVDYSGYPDCRQQYFDAFIKMAKLGTRAGVEGDDLKIHTPIMSMRKVEIIQTGLMYGVDYSLTHSCYDPDPQTGKPCGACDSCIIRGNAFKELGYKADPALVKYG